LEQAQKHYKQHYDRKLKEVEFQVGQWVWLRLLHRSIALLSVHGRSKLGLKFHGPFQVIERVKDVAYKLKLQMGASPEGEKCHVGVPLSEAPKKVEHHRGRGGNNQGAQV
jgi:hypothetical protein